MVKATLIAEAGMVDGENAKPLLNPTMSDPSLLAILFVSSSSKGSHLVFRWPTRPQAVRRLARPKPITRQLDYAWRAAHPTNNRSEPEDRPFAISTHGNTDALGLINDSTANKNKAAETRAKSLYDDDEQNPAYEWKLQEWGGHLGSRDGNPGSTAPSPRRRTPGAPGGSSSRRSTNADFTGENQRDPDFDWVLGYKTKLLAEHVFRFDRNLCNQRFELILEELLFLGHPVCIGDDGTWQWEQLYSDPKQKKEEERGGDRSATGSELVAADPKNEASLKSFHFILVLDRPDPALGGNANLTRFVDVYYEQLAVKMTAALHYEQSRDGYVEKETDLLVDLMETCEHLLRLFVPLIMLIQNIAESYRDFMDAALDKSSLARAIREIFVGVQNQRLAHVTVGEFELDLQMPWYHSELLLGEQDPEGAGEYSVEDERDERWDPGFGKGWRVKRLLPWNTLLFLEGWELGSTEAEPDEMTKFRDVLTPDIS
jgi:nitrogen permease regulator 3-like protein